MGRKSQDVPMQIFWTSKAFLNGKLYWAIEICGHKG